jgi:hypothetical protein
MPFVRITEPKLEGIILKDHHIVNLAVVIPQYPSIKRHRVIATIIITEEPVEPRFYSPPA